MRRSIALVLACLLCLSVAAPVAAKGRPTITHLSPTVLGPDVFAGTCPFPVELVDSFSSSKEMAFEPDENGDQLFRYTGGFRSTVTNLDSGESIDIHYFGKGDWLFRADGSIDIRTTGSVLVWIYEEDVLSAFEPGIYVMTGSLTTSLDGATGFALGPEVFRGRIVDLCDALS